MNEQSDLKTSPWIAILLGVVLGAMALIIALTVASAYKELRIKKGFRNGLDGYYLGRSDQSLPELRTCMQTKPSFAPAYEVAASVHYMKGELDEAQTIYTEAVGNAGARETPVSVMGLAVIQAARVAGKRDTSAMKVVAGQIEGMRDSVPFEVDALINAAAIRLCAGDVSGGRRLLRQLGEKQPVYARTSFPVLANARGVLAYHEGHTEDAMNHFRHAAGLAGGWGAPQANLSALCISTVSSKNTPSEVIEKLFSSLHTTDTSAFSKDDAYLYHNTLGIVAYMRLGWKYYERAVQNFDKAITVKPDKPWAKLNKAAVMMLHTDRVTDRKQKIPHIEATEKLYLNILEGKGIDEKTRYLIYNVLGMLAMKKNDPDKALEYFLKAYEMRKDDYLVCRNLGIQHYRLKHYAEAKRFYGESSKLRKGQEEVEKVLDVLRAAPKIEAASLRYTTEARPVVGVKASVHSCPATVENCRVDVTFSRSPAFFKVRSCYITCTPANDLEAGRHKLNVTVTDPAGNKTTRAFDLSVDRRPPTFAGVKPKAGGAIRGNNPTIELKAWDELSEVDLTSIYLKYMTGPGQDFMVSQEVLKDGKFQYDMPKLNIKKGQGLSSSDIKFVPKNSLPGGNYRLQVEGRDVVGNRAKPVRWDFTIIE